MLSKNKAKYLTLLSSKKQRTKNGEFLVEGKKLVEEMLKNNWEVVEVYATNSYIDSNQNLPESIPVIECTEQDLKKIGNLESNNSVAALVKTKNRTIKDLQWEQELCLVLDDIKDPGNLGTIIRTATWFGINNIVCSSTCVDMYNPKVVQSSMGGIFTSTIYYTDLIELFQEASKLENFNIYGAYLNGGSPEILNNKKTGFVVLGSESHGISKELTPFINEKITIPQGLDSTTESLNVAIANAILCYELSKK